MTEERDSGIRRELGISRRDLLKRGAVVGGTLIWAAPVIESLAAPAFASTSPVVGSCCQCEGTDSHGNTVSYALTDDYDCATCATACSGSAPPGVSGGHMVALYHGTGCKTTGGSNSGLCDTTVSTCPQVSCPT